MTSKWTAENEYYANLHGVWVAFESNISGKEIARAETARELANICNTKIQCVIRAQQNQECQKYKFFETEDEANEYILRGLNYSKAVLHVPTGNRWADTNEAAEWLEMPAKSLAPMTRENSFSAVKNFRIDPGIPEIKDTTLRMIKTSEYGLNSAWKDIWESMPGNDYEIYKDAPNYETWAKIQEEKKIAAMSPLGIADVKKDNLGIPVRVIDNSEYLHNCQIGEVGTLISKKGAGLHPYKVMFSKGTVLYTRPDQVEVVG